MTGLTYFVIAGVACVLLSIGAVVRWANKPTGSDEALNAGILAAFGGVGTLVALIIVIACVVDRVSCGDKAEALGRDSRWAIATGCLVETDNGDYVPLGKLRITDIEGD